MRLYVLSDATERRKLQPTTVWISMNFSFTTSLAISSHVFADANFPTSQICRQGPREVRADGHDITRLLDAVLQLMPLDHYVPYRAVVMGVLEEDVKKGLPATMPVWKKYCEAIKKAGEEPILHEEERFQFYERAKKAFAVVHTGETSLYGNIILKMGVIPQ